MEATKVIDIEQENLEIIRRYRKLLRYAKPVLKEGDTKVIRKAFDTAVEGHKDMRRKSGEPYIYHPIEVAQICVEEIGLGTTSIVAALLHDVVEDTPTTLDDMEKAFGRKVTRIIDGLTKISGVIEIGSSQQAENFRKMVVALSDDVRVILIKLADRLHNMRTLDSMPRHKQLKIANETIYMYAPLAHRLGLYTIKSELEDLYLKYTDRDAYYSIASKLQETRADRNKFIREFISPIQRELRNKFFEFKIKGRPKSIFSIWNKMKKQNIPFEEVYDLFAIRIIINADIEHEKTLCWQVYSIITDNYKPNPDRLRDWISTPKANGYESLHTTVMSKLGKWVEVQIRTERMDEISEKGYAAHWKYKENSEANKKSGLDNWIDKVREILHNDSNSALEFVDDFRLNLYNEEIFVFTPKGDLKMLPLGSTALDFAFEVHTQVGAHCMGAKVNHKLVPISHRLKNGDQVEIITSNKQNPSEDWLRVVLTSKAKKKIKDHLTSGRKQVVTDGKEKLLAKMDSLSLKSDVKSINNLTTYFKAKDTNDLYYLVGKGAIDLKELEKVKEEDYKKKIQARNDERDHETKIIKELNKDSLIIGDIHNDIKYTLAKCCNPIPGDDVFGFVTVNEGVKIHRTKCPNAMELMANYGYRIIKAAWRSEHQEAYLTGLKVVGTDRIGIINDITQVITKSLNVNIQSFRANTLEGLIEDIIMVHVKDTKHLTQLIKNLEKIEGLIKVERFDPKLEEK